MNIGEEICGEWLRHIKRCDFIQYNLQIPDAQGEIDVIGINLKQRRVYACEVAIHLITGLRYVKSKRPDNVPRLTRKFRKDCDYVRKYFRGYDHVLMLWSPVVKNQKKGSKYNQLNDINQIIDEIHAACGIKIEAMINESFQAALAELRQCARDVTAESASSVLRYLQIEERLAHHLKLLRSKG